MPSPLAMLPPIAFLTTAGRDSTLAGALDSLCKSDWPIVSLAPSVFRDPAARTPAGVTLDPLVRLTAAWCSFLGDALARFSAPYFLLCEDDLLFHPHFAAALHIWPPLRASRIRTYASLYNPGVPSASEPPDGALSLSADPAKAPWFIADPRFATGAQALIIAREFAQHAVLHWDDFGGAPSRRLARLAARDFPAAPIYYHRPSLVEHAAAVSSWGSRLHRSVDFDPAWVPGAEP